MGKKDISKTMTLKDGVSGTLNKVSAGTVRYKKNLKDLQTVGTKTWGSIRNGMSSIITSAAGAATAILGVTGAASAISFGTGISSELESYRLTLETVLKDTKRAGEVMQWASKFANITPFDTTEVIEGSVRLQAYGISAQSTMKSIGDMAAVMNKDLMQAIEAVADAQTGELERLKEFGITKAMLEKKSGEMFRNQIVVNNKGQIVDQQKFNQALFALMDERFQGGMDKQAKTFKGLMSTITGTWKTGLAEMMGVSAAGEIREGSVFAQLKSGADSLVNTINQLSESGAFKKVGDGLANILQTSVNTFNFFRDNWSNISPIIYGVVGSLAAYKVSVMVATAWTTLFGTKSTFAAIKTSIMGTASMVASGQMGILTAAQRGLNAAMRANPIGFVITLLGLLVTAGIYVVKNWETVKLAGMNTWNTVVDWTEWAYNELVDSANYIEQAFKYAFNSIEYYGTSIWNGIISAGENGISSLLGPLNDLRGKLGLDAINVNFSSVKFGTVTKPTWDDSFTPYAKVNFRGAKFSDDTVMAQMQRAQQEKEAKKEKADEKLVSAIEANTAATQNNTDSTDTNTDATKKNTAAKLKDMQSSTDIADSILGRIERHLYGT